LDSIKVFQQLYEQRRPLVSRGASSTPSLP